MSKEFPSNLAASVLDRLGNESKRLGRPFNEVLQHFAIERFLYRLSCSRFADRFILKGALMLRAREIDLYRPTMDIDLSGYVPNSIASISEIIRECIATEVEDDGVRFDASSLQAHAITQHAEYSGVRIIVMGTVGKTRLRVQVDVASGDVVVAGPVWIDYPALLDQPRPHILIYSLESAIAEKFSAMVTLEMNNSRMKDFYDIYNLCIHCPFDGAQLAKAIGATFSQRRVVIPLDVPIALTSTFAEDPAKQVQWKAFCRRKIPYLSAISSETIDLVPIIDKIREFLLPPAHTAARGERFVKQWTPRGPWI